MNWVSGNDLEQVGDEIAVSYQRDVQTGSIDRQPPPDGSCTWPETRERPHQHFAPTRQNVSFYLVVDEGGVNAWAQWDGPTDMMFLAPSLLNVVMELDCLYPMPDWLIVTVVDEIGEANLIGVVQGEALRSDDYAEAINQFYVLYP